MTADREQVRRDAEQYAKGAWMEPMPAPVKLARHCLALLAELEQAERERDELREWLDHEKQVTRDLSARLDPHAKGAGLGTRSIHAQRLDAEYALTKRAERAEQREAALVEALREMVGAFGGFSDDPPVIRKARAALAAHEQAKP